MRVALFSRNARSADAIGQQVAARLHFFQQRGAEVRVFLSEGDSSRLSSVAPIPGSAARIWKTQQEYLRSADLIVAEFGAAYDLMNLLPALAGQGPRIIVDYHGITPPSLVEPTQQNEIDAACQQRELLWCADLILVHSRFAEKELIAATGLPVERIHQIPCFLRPTSKAEAALAPILRARHQLQDKRIILFVGRFARNKHPEQLIEVLPQLTVDTHLVFLGPQGDIYREHLLHCQQRAQVLGVTHRTHFLGTMSDTELAGWYHAADVLALPSEHECFGMPVLEAMQRGTPVVVAPYGALPEVVDHAGLQAAKDDLVQILLRLAPLSPLGREAGGEGNLLDFHAKKTAQSSPQTRKIALVAHRFGNQFAGGAERSLRLMASALQTQGYTVEVFTTCNTHECQWKNSLRAGTTREDGFIVHRFPIDSYDAEKLGEAYQQVQQGKGNVSPEVERAYLQNSLGSTALIEALNVQRHEFAAILTGPYLFRLVHDVVQHFTEQVLLAPCFHDEPLAKLRCFQGVYRQAGGLIFHSEPEARLTAELLGISQPRHAVVGTLLPPDAMKGDAEMGLAGIGSPYLVYCGRYCPEKGLDRLLEYVEQLQLHTTARHAVHEREDSIKLVCLGQGPMKLPKRPWLIDAGFVSEQEKRDLLAGALALVNLSRNESLSIVALEAWAVKVPVIVDSQCAVLVDQVQRSQGGFIVQHAEEFTAAVETLLPSPDRKLRAHPEISNHGKQRGESGHRYVREHYLHPEHFAGKLSGLVASLALPLREVASQKGIERASLFCATVWEERFAQLIEKAQLQESHAVEHKLAIEPLQPRLHASPQMTSLPVGIKLKNMGTTVLPAHGPAAAELVVRVVEQHRIEMTRGEIIPLAQPLQPGKEALLIAAFSFPKRSGRYRVQLQIKQRRRRLASRMIPLLVSEQPVPTSGAHPLQPILQEVRTLLGDATRLQKLPSDYVDVTEGRFASIKKAIKTKLLHNFRKALVEPAFRQQSALNEKLLAAICLLVEGQSAQDVTASQAQLLRHIRQLERQLKQERRARRKLERQIAQLADSPQLILTEGNAS